jgi:hypothetical protein
MPGSLVGCAGTTTKEATGEYVDDTVISSKVKAAILNEPITTVEFCPSSDICRRSADCRASGEAMFAV